MKLLRWIPVALLAGAMLLMAACGGDDDGGLSGVGPGGDDDRGADSGNGDEDGGSDSENGGSGDGDGPDDSFGRPTGGSCEVELSGDISGEFEGGGDQGSVGTDYWFSDDELREALTFLQTGTEAEKKAKVDEIMADDPRLFLLVINCEAGDVSISFLPSGDSKYADVPFKTAREYRVQEGLFGGSDTPGEFAALITVRGDPFGVSEEGTLTITRFDESAIEGSFEFGIEEAFGEGTPTAVRVSGRFSYPCSGGEVCD